MQYRIHLNNALLAAVDTETGNIGTFSRHGLAVLESVEESANVCEVYFVIPPPASDGGIRLDEVERTLVRDKQRVVAIKRVRERLNLSLRDALEAVKAYEAVML